MLGWLHRNCGGIGPGTETTRLQEIDVCVSEGDGLLAGSSCEA